MIASPFPSAVAFVVVSAADSLEIHEEEERFCAQWGSATRRASFLRGRTAARRAAAQLGRTFAGPLGTGDAGEPLWPPGLIGSLTHTKELAIAAVAPAQDYQLIGIDLEDRRRELPPSVRDRICREAEKTWVNEGEDRLLMIFSAKESLYKALYPLLKRRFWFHDVELSWDACQGVFNVDLRGLGCTHPDLGEVQIHTDLSTRYILSSIVA